MPNSHFQVFNGITNDINTTGNKPVTWTERVDIITRAFVEDDQLYNNSERNKILKVFILYLYVL
jgi:hypothetical protein